MNSIVRILFGASLLSPLNPYAFAVDAANEAPYRVLQTAQFEGSGGIDYVYADSAARRLYIPRGNEVRVFDLDTLKPVGIAATTRAHGVAVDAASHHGFCSSSPVMMWDSQSLQPIKSIEVQGRPDGIMAEPTTQRVFVFSHSAPHVTVIDAKAGTVVGTIDLGGAPEQAASDGAHLFIDIEDKDKVAVVDLKTLQVTGEYSLQGKGGTPAGLALDPKNHVLFVLCRNPQTCVVMNADDGKIIDTLPIGRGTDGGTFNPATSEAFSSQGDGTLSVIRELSPTEFKVAQTVTTKARAKTCTLDPKTGHVLLITTEPMPGATPPASEPAASGGPRKGGFNGPALLDILVVGK